MKEIIFYAAFSQVFHLVLTFNYLTHDYNSTVIDKNYPKPPLDSSLQKDLDFIQKVKKEGIMTACLVLTRNSIVKNHPNVTFIMQNTPKEKKAKTFDKIALAIVQNCVNRIDYSIADNILHADNITLLDAPEIAHTEFNREEFESKSLGELTNEEYKILGKIYGRAYVEENYPLLGKKEKKANNTEQILGVDEKRMLVEEKWPEYIITKLHTTYIQFEIAGFICSLVVCFIMWKIIRFLFYKKEKVVIVQTKTVETTTVKKKK